MLKNISTKKLILIGLCILLFLAVVYMVYLRKNIIYKIKTLGVTKYELTVYAKDRFSGEPVKFIPVTIHQKINFTKYKELFSKKTDKNGIVVFYLPEGRYLCFVTTDKYWGNTDYIYLKGDKETEMLIIKLLRVQ